MSISKIEELAQRGALEEVDATDGAHPVDMEICYTIDEIAEETFESGNNRRPSISQSSC